MMVLGCSHGEPKIIPLPIVGKFAGYCVPRSKDTCGTEAGFPRERVLLTTSLVWAHRWQFQRWIRPGLQRAK